VNVTPTAAELKSFSLAAARLWKLDDQRLVPEVDYSLNLQYGTKPYRTGDNADEALFDAMDLSVLKYPTFKAFSALLDNYERSTGITERVTRHELQENSNFLKLCAKTAPMKYAHKYLAARHLSPADPNKFLQQLSDLWFKLYRRGTHNDSCGFEHVFVGEERDGKIMGMHNWIQLFHEEKSGHLNYHGFIPARGRHAKRPVDSDQVITIQFSWDGALKPISTSFMGVSPQFELALYTMAFLDGNEDHLCEFEDGRYRVNVKCYSIGHGNSRKIGTAFPEGR
jgi:poly(U)-specific endoribonuclease